MSNGTNMADKNCKDFFHLRDVLGQMTFLKSYTIITLGFPLDETPGAFETVLKDLEEAAGKLVSAFPWAAGHVIREGAGPGVTGLATVIAYPQGERPTPLIHRDCAEICPPFKSIVAEGAPFSMLDGGVLAVRKGLPDSYDESEEPAPVLVIQANLVRGGLILAFQGNHNLMDMNGMGQLIRLYAKALRGETFSELEIEHGNRDRRDIIKLLGPDDEKVDLSRYIVKEAPATTQIQAPPPDIRWVYIHFPANKVAKLKAAASRHADDAEGQPVQWISGDDALCALLCQRITVARLQRMGTAPRATFCRAVNARRFLVPPIPTEYVGHVVTCVYTQVPLESPTATQDLTGLARQLRKDVLGIRSVEIQALATALDASDDKGAFSYAANLNPAGFDLMLSSWSGLGLNHTEFGKVLGRPAFSKRPNLTPMEGLLYLLPRTVDGDVDVACCLRAEDIEKLKSDKEMTNYAQVIY